MINAKAIAAVASEKAAAKPSKSATKRLEAATKRLEKAASVKTESSLDKASAKGMTIARRKTSKIVVAQPAKKTARKAKPTKTELQQEADKRKADIDLVQQALAHSIEIAAKGEAAKAPELLIALSAIANLVPTFELYLPNDFSTV